MSDFKIAAIVVSVCIAVVLGMVLLFLATAPGLAVRDECRQTRYHVYLLARYEKGEAWSLAKLEC